MQVEDDYRTNTYKHKNILPQRKYRSMNTKKHETSIHIRIILLLFSFQQDIQKAW